MLVTLDLLIVCFIKVNYTNDAFCEEVPMADYLDYVVEDLVHLPHHNKNSEKTQQLQVLLNSIY